MKQKLSKLEVAIEAVRDFFNQAKANEECRYSKPITISRGDWEVVANVIIDISNNAGRGLWDNTWMEEEDGDNETSVTLSYGDGLGYLKIQRERRETLAEFLAKRAAEQGSMAVSTQQVELAQYSDEEMAWMWAEYYDYED